MMAFVTISTIYQTAFIAEILLVSKGWNISRGSLTRNELSTITLLMGAVYLTYSAYYVSANLPPIRFFIGVIIIIDLMILVSIESSILSNHSSSGKESYSNKNSAKSSQSLFRQRKRHLLIALSQSKAGHHK